MVGQGGRGLRTRLFSPITECLMTIHTVDEQETDHFTFQQSLKDGLEWRTYIPRQRQHATPILMQHGMWHGAWCWQPWQELLAEWGWESHAISLPGHGLSPMQRPIRLCTLDYYLPFIRHAVDSLPRQPILMGHSMGGALAQWYLRDVGNLPAVVLVAAWALYKGFLPSWLAFVKLDPAGMLLSGLKFYADFVRTPENAAGALLSPQSVVTPASLYAQLCRESLLVMLQHALPWSIPPNITTPILWLGGEHDAVIPEPASRRSAVGYGADYVMISGAAHNLMMEPNFRDIAQQIDHWLSSKVTD